MREDRLELGAIRTALISRARTPLGSAEADALGPFDRRADAIDRIELISEARDLLVRKEEPPTSGATDVTAPLELAEKGGTLDASMLRAVAETMNAAVRVRRFLLTKEDTHRRLFAIGASVEDLSATAELVSGSFDPDGRLADTASKDLGPLRKKLLQCREAIKERLLEILASDEVKNHLQDQYYTIRADRYVLPIKASFKNEVPGIVHDASGSGQTVFIEPQAIVDLGNRLKIAQSEVAEEELRILMYLTDEVVALKEEILTAMRAVGRVDFIAAAARLAEDIGASAIVPDESPGFELISARHPILALQKFENKDALLVANDLGLASDQRVLVVTGPNTGGKTVALKTIGLLALMTRTGLHLPTDQRSRMGWFANVDATIGDDQSIATHLSTFAAHMTGILRILERADANSLVLLDEIAADTDPNQGQSLAQALLERFADRGAHVVVTTHFERLKAIPFADTRFRNAGVGFDPEKLRPTYRVSLDVPQSSSGLDIAQTLGLDPTIVARARTLMGEGNTAIDGLTKVLQEKALELDRARARADAERDELVAQQQSLDEQRRALAGERKTLIEEARAGLLAEIEEVRREAREIIANLQRLAGADAVKDAMRAANEAQAALRDLADAQRRKVEEVQAASERPSRVEVGDWVRVDSLKKDGEVVAIDGRAALVAVGSMRTRVPLEGLSRAQSKAPKGATRHGSMELKKAMEEARGKKEAPLEPEMELDLRGQGIEESLSRLDAFLDTHYRQNATKVRIIHGHGSGALKKAIREHLKRSGYAKDFRAGTEGEGGDGATIVTLS
ncbi:MAG: endonuclease MutS2 [Deltaproteobacteria bacterium]|nr:endonuclease MutS2 [Deltaproteobacteria bacterium]